MTAKKSQVCLDYSESTEDLKVEESSVEGVRGGYYQSRCQCVNVLERIEKLVV